MSARLATVVAIGLTMALAPAIPSAQAQGFGFATFSAAIKSNGKTNQSSGVKKTKRTGNGLYEVTFMRRIDSCIYVASPQGTGGGQASVKLLSNKKLRIDTFSKSGVRTNLGFTLLVSCI